MTAADGWLRRAVTFAGHLSAEAVERAADLIEAHGIEAAVGADVIMRLGLSSAAASRWTKLIDAAREDASRPDAGRVASALRAAAIAIEGERGEGRPELLWTGPAGGDAALRRIDQAVVELVDAARSDLLIVTFSASAVTELIEALRRAADRGVRLTFVKDFEKTEQSQDPAAMLGAAATGARVLTWPLASRPTVGDWSALLHAKCAVADEALLLVSSANVSPSAFARNMELGLLVRGGDLPRRVRRHFLALAAAGVLRPQ